MKKNYFTILVLLAFFFYESALAQETQKNLINYQGVARNAANELMANEAMNLGLAIRFSSSSATVDYEESHSLTTDANGVFSLKIGNGNVVSGNYDNLSWGSGAAFVTVSINGSEIGTTELMAVPYAITSGDSDNQSAAEVPYDNSVSNLTSTNTQEAIDELVNSGNVDADADPTNELQTISFDSNTNELSLTDGGTITIPSGGTDADADPTNELQDISLSGTNLSISDGSTINLAPIIPLGGTDDQSLEINGDVLSIENGNGSVDLSTYRDDLDADPTNEHQILSFDSNTSELSLSDGNTVTLPNGGGSGTDDQNLELNSDVLSIENGSGSVDLGSYRDDADADPTNEHQTLSFDGATNELSLSDGNTVILPNGGGSSLWTANGDDIENGNSGNVGIGAISKGAKLHIESNSNLITPQIKIEENGNDYARLEFTNDVSSAFWHVAGLARDTPSESKLNFFYSGSSGNTDHMTITGDGKVGIGTNSPQASMHVVGNIRSTDLEGTGERNVVADVDGNLTIGAGGIGATKIDELSDGKSDIYSVFLGVDAGDNDDGTNFNVGVGLAALNYNTTGFENTANGYQALRYNTTGSYNTANGANALISNTIGSQNTANGHSALRSNTAGSENTANGYQALYSNTIGNANTAMGQYALYSNTTGSFNTASGLDALSTNTNGGTNAAFGYRALFRNTSGSYNTALGHEALRSNTQGFFNTAIGRGALWDNTTGSYNTAIGREALLDNTVGVYNTACGHESLWSNITGNSNAAIGSAALRRNTTGSYNTAVGVNALRSNTVAENNIALGYNAQVDTPGWSNQVRIGNDQIFFAGIQVAWTVTSDRRWKDKVRELPYGLDMVSRLRPVDYVRKNNERKKREVGFIAQEVETVLNEIGYSDQGFLTKDVKGYMSLRYNDFIPVLTKAIKEQQKIINSLKKEQENTRALVLELQTQLTKLVGQNDKKEVALQK